MPKTQRMDGADPDATPRVTRPVVILALTVMATPEERGDNWARSASQVRDDLSKFQKLRHLVTSHSFSAFHAARLVYSVIIYNLQHRGFRRQCRPRTSRRLLASRRNGEYIPIESTDDMYVLPAIK
jgi:hypothetical protein